jgi:hypothetical protein
MFHTARASAAIDQMPLVAQNTLDRTSAAAGETLKERLSNKASDEQRVDNCKVPLDRRGPKPRPDSCQHDDGTTALTQRPRWSHNTPDSSEGAAPE